MPQDTVYPKSESATTSPDSFPPSRLFFSPVPRHIWALAEAGHVSGRDVQLLGLLLDYKRKDGSPIVGPGQKTLARRLACSTDTIQRALSRLVKAGLIDKLPQRSRDGRRRGNHYDLAKTLAYVPSTRAAKMRPGPAKNEAGAVAEIADGKRPKSESEARPQKCGVEVESDVAEANNSAPPESADGAAAPSPVVEANVKKVALRADNPETRAQAVGSPEVSPGAQEKAVTALREAGVHRPERLVERYGPDRCQRAVAAAPARAKTSQAAWIVAAVCGGWNLPPLRAAASVRRPSQGMAAAAREDILSGLTGAELAALETRAREQLIAENGPPVRQSLERGRSTSLVKARMRELLAQASKNPQSEAQESKNPQSEAQESKNPQSEAQESEAAK